MASTRFPRREKFPFGFFLLFAATVISGFRRTLSAPPSVILRFFRQDKFVQMPMWHGRRADWPNACGHTNLARAGHEPAPAEESHMTLLRRLRAAGAALVLAAAASAAATPYAAAQDYPNKTVRLVVAFPAGGPTDFVARVLADKLKSLLGQNVIVENKAGANAAIGAEYVAKSEPDGHTLFLSTSGAIVINPHMRANLPYDPVRDFAPVTLVVNTKEVLVVRTDTPMKSAPDLVALAKSRPDGIAMASTGVGSPPHLALELFKGSSGANVLHVPYRGAAPAVTDVVGGQVHAMFADLPVLMPQIRGGTLRPIGVGSKQRAAVLPDVPTLDEQGIKDVYADNWYALFAPAKTPAPVVAKINAAVTAALNDPELNKKLIDAGADPSPGTPAQLADFVKSELERWGKVIKEKNIKEGS
jgi:tripartite-type tricarboxylate transporter receptor subunit TctC